MHHYIKSVYEEYFKEFHRTAPQRCRLYGGDTDKPHGQAASLESLLCFIQRAWSKDIPVLDAGAGASTYVLRHHFTNVQTIDPDAEFMEAVKEVCRIKGLGTQGFTTDWKDLKKVKYTYYDFGTKERIPRFEDAWGLTEEAMYVDDTDTRKECQEYRNWLKRFASLERCKLVDCVEARDSFDRWGVWIERG